MVRSLIRALRPFGWFCLAALGSACHRVDLYITELPPETPETEAVYAAGNFNGWKEADPKYRFTRLADGRLYLPLDPMAGKLRFKLMRGGWASVETDSCGSELEEHVLDVRASSQVALSVKSWKDYSSARCDYVDLRISQAPSFARSEAMYAAGSFNDWRLRDERYRFSTDSTGAWTVRLPRSSGSLEFQINRGNWANVEADASGLPQTRVLIEPEARSVHELRIVEWSDRVAAAHPNLWIIVEDAPEFLPGESLYFASDINNWNPYSEDHRLEYEPETGTHFIKIARSKASIYFKITRGGWDKVETDSEGNEIENRSWDFQKQDSLRIRIAGWRDQLKGY